MNKMEKFGKSKVKETTNQIQSTITDSETDGTIRIPVPDKLEEIEREIEYYVENFQLNLWDIGDRLNHINENNLWTSFKNEDGSQVYKTFVEYIEDRIPLSYRWGYFAIQIRLNYERDILKTFSKPHHLTLLLRIKNKEKREELTEEVISNPDKYSHRRLQQKVQEINKPSEQNNQKKSYIKFRKRKDTISFNLKDFNLDSIEKEQLEYLYKGIEELLLNYQSTSN